MKVYVVLALLLAGCTAATETPPAGPSELAADPELLAHLEAMARFPEVRLETDHGTIRMLLYTEWLPITTGHIGGLVERGFYDGLTIHRVVDDFVIQGGDPTGTGEGGSGPAGTSDMIPLEIKQGLQFGSGAVGLARWTDDTGDSQWFITEKPALHLNDPQGATGDVFGAYALFAQVFDGMDVVRSIAAVDTIPQADRPVEDVLIRSAELLAPAADVNLLQIVVEVTTGFNAGGPKTLELPRYAVEGVPFTMRMSMDTPESGECQPPQFVAFHEGADEPWGSGNSIEAYYPVATGDPCTFEANATLPAGTWYLVGDDDVGTRNTPVPLFVRPWHDAYAPYTGQP